MGIITRSVTRFYRLLEALNLEFDLAPLHEWWFRYQQGLYTLYATAEFARSIGAKPGLIAEVGIAPILNWVAIRAVGIRGMIKARITPIGEELKVEAVFYTRWARTRRLSAFTVPRTSTFDELYEKMMSVIHASPIYR